GKVHQRGHVVAESLELLEALINLGFLLDGVDGAAALLSTDDLLCQVGLVLDIRTLSHHDDLVVGHVGLGEVDVLLAFFGNGQAVPKHIDTLAVQFGFLCAPVDRLEFNFDTQALGCFAGQINVETDQLILLVTKTHGREVVVKADHDFASLFLGGGLRLLCGGVVARAAGSQKDSGGCQKNTSQFFHFSNVLRTKKAKERPMSRARPTGSIWVRELPVQGRRGKRPKDRLYRPWERGAGKAPDLCMKKSRPGCPSRLFNMNEAGEISLLPRTLPHAWP